MAAYKSAIFNRKNPAGSGSAPSDTAGVSSTEFPDEFVTPDWFFPQPTALQFAMEKTAGGTSSATITIWVWDDNLATTKKWFAYKTGLIITEGNVSASVPVAAFTRCYVQVTAVSGTPTALIGRITNN